MIIYSWLYIIDLQVYFLEIHFYTVAFSRDDTELPLQQPVALSRYSMCKPEDGGEQRQRKTGVSEDVNYWLTFEWTLLGLRIREMSNRCSLRAAWAIEPSSANWWHHEGREWVSEREGGREERPLCEFTSSCFIPDPLPNSVVHTAAY